MGFALLILPKLCGGRHTKNAKRSPYDIMRSARYLLFVLPLLLTVPLNVSVRAAFENIGIIAGPMGMGGAYAAATHDTSALIWNPAGLARLHAPEIGIGYLDMYGVLGYSFLGIAHPIRTGRTVAAAILSSSDTEGISQERIMLLSSATRVWRQLHAGINAKYFNTSVHLEQGPLGRGAGWGADLGIQYALMTEKVRIGVVFPNLFSNLSYRRLEGKVSNGAYNESLMREWRIGFAAKLEPLLAAFEIENGHPLIGWEYQHNTTNRTFTMRLGWRFTDGVSRGLTAGFGYQHGNIALDYALVDGRYGSQTSLFSVRLFY